MSEIHQAADDLLEPTIAEIARGADGVEIERKVFEGSAAEVLVNVVDLLAASSAGTGGFTGLLLGSLSQQWPRPCPVVIVYA